MTAQDFIRRPSVSSLRNNRLYGLGKLVDNDILPWSHFITAANAPDEIFDQGTGIIQLTNSLWYFSSLSWTTGTNGMLAWDFYTAAGTWRLEEFLDKRNDYGIMRTLVDDIQVGLDIDRYASTRVRFVNRIDNIALSRGWHRIKLKIVGKNSSSANYLLVVSGLALTRTS